ncbi:ferritin-like domain-containing protein [Candidatus Aerophobetes bacterium]|uniref:Ferritin-like domain-containing protein n=1 Tax=Aerophobetes bacterium TaxID=2030807 RepID=A0A523QLV7_UNCAE|nr:MAG: ferritin-like domain-containing protein [Candidatus Aerophobetes bacterium]
MAITKEKLVEKLNGDLAREYTAIVQYAQHSGVITGAEYGDIKKELIVHAGEELQHALTLADQIDYLDGSPTAKVLPANTSVDNKEMLQQDLDGENEAIERYIERIGETEELKLLHLAQKLREILAMEQEHAMDLQQALGK